MCKEYNKLNSLNPPCLTFCILNFHSVIFPFTEAFPSETFNFPFVIKM